MSGKRKKRIEQFFRIKQHQMQEQVGPLASMLAGRPGFNPLRRFKRAVKGSK